MKSHYQQNAEQAQALLGEGLCLAKWQQVSLHLPTGLNNSCYHPPLHEIDATAVELNPSALHNTEHKKQQRKIMLKHERPSECGYCWRVEDLGLGLLSDRHYRSGEPWAMEHYDDIVGIAIAVRNLARPGWKMYNDMEHFLLKYHTMIPTILLVVENPYLIANTILM